MRAFMQHSPQTKQAIMGDKEEKKKNFVQKIVHMVHPDNLYIITPEIEYSIISLLTFILREDHSEHNRIIGELYREGAISRFFKIL